MRLRRRSGDCLLLLLAWLALLDAQLRLRVLRQRLQLLQRAEASMTLQRIWHPTPVRVCRAVERAARFVPAATCLPQALSAKHLLQWFGYDAQLQIGVMMNGSGLLEAHAWVEYAGMVVIGGPVHGVNQFVKLRPGTR